MNRNAGYFAGFGRIAWARRVGTLAVALLLASSFARADGLAKQLTPGGCVVWADYLGSGDLDIFADGEEWVEFSIELTPQGDVLVDGIIAGNYSPLTGARVEVRVNGPDALIEVRDGLTGEICCAQSVNVGPVDLAVATGTAIALESE